MKEYNETEAIALMSAVLPEELRDDDADLIYDYYEDNGDLDLDLEGDDEADINGMTAYISRFLRKNAPAVQFSDEHIAAMIAAEIEYENSLI